MVQAAKKLGLTDEEAAGFRPPSEATEAMLACYAEVAESLGWLNERTGPILAAVEGVGMTATFYGVPTYQLVAAQKRRRQALARAANPRPTTPGPEEPRAGTMQ